MEDGSRLRVALFGNFLSASLGGRSICEDLADRFADRGIDVVKASSRPQPLRRLLDMLVTASRERRRYDVAYIDLYSGRGFIWAESVALLLTSLGKPFVLTLRGGNLPAFSEANPGRVRRLLRSARFVVAPSRYLAQAMRAFRDDIEILPNAVDVAAYDGRIRMRAAPRFVWLRSFHHMYDPTLAVRVLAAVRDRYPEATLVMAGRDKGDGSLAETIAEAERLGVRDRVELPGDVPKARLPHLLGAADIFLNTTTVDNQPVSVLEAMAAGLCIVTTNVGGIPDLCAHGDNAFLVPPRDPGAMSRACLNVIEDPELARTLSTGALRRSKAFDREPMLTEWERLLRAATR